MGVRFLQNGNQKMKIPFWVSGVMGVAPARGQHPFFRMDLRAIVSAYPYVPQFNCIFIIEIQCSHYLHIH